MVLSVDESWPDTSQHSAGKPQLSGWRARLWLAGGCAAIDRDPSCGCQSCQTPPSDVGVLGKVTNDFHNLVIGSNEEPAPEVRRSKRQVASSEAPTPSRAKRPAAEAEQVAMTTEPAATEVAVAPPMAAAPTENVAPGPYATVDNCGASPPGLVAGPAGRFFPVPARPVFSPQYGPQYGGCELR